MTAQLYRPAHLRHYGPPVAKSWLLDVVETLHEQYRLLNSIYFLVRQGDTFGERLRCVKCNGRHDYITLNCIERPFPGITGGLYAYYHLIKDNGLERFMSPEERSRYDGIVEMLDDIPDLSKTHPRMARELVKDLGPSDLKAGALSLGVLEGISEVDARRRVMKINDRGLRPKLVLSDLNPYDKIRLELRRGA